MNVHIVNTSCGAPRILRPDHVEDGANVCGLYTILPSHHVAIDVETETTRGSIDDMKVEIP
eukprot:9056718-Karenia_brevis.AAC.1